MASQDAFDPHTFLAHIGAGRTITAYRQHSPIFAQGDVADAVFYIQRGQVQTSSWFPGSSSLLVIQVHGSKIATSEERGGELENPCESMEK